jgi:hypothetical protein
MINLASVNPCYEFENKEYRYDNYSFLAGICHSISHEVDFW